MDKKNLILSSIEPEDLQKLIREAVADVLNQQKLQKIAEVDEELLSRQEVADIYKTSFVTLRQWEVDGIIPKPIRKNKRVYFRKSEIYEDIKAKDKYRQDQ